MAAPSRSSLTITFSVWKALFLHLAQGRISGSRASWFWLVAEPLAHMAFLVYLLVALRHRVVAGMDAYVWVVVGLVAFFTFRRAAMQGMHAVDDNKAMFAYRQVKPVDTVLVRAALETFLMLLIGMAAFALLFMLGHDIAPHDPLLVLAAAFGIWLLALGLGLTLAVPIKLIKESAVFLNFLFMPLYLLSGVIFPINSIPYPYKDWLLRNPVVHAIEAARLGFSPSYHAVAGLDLSYLYAWGICLIFIGLVLQVRFADRLIAQ
jgi:capsular polysaccharide transport system permease protein